MRLIKKKFSLSARDKAYIPFPDKNNVLFLDIETTGLSPKNSFVYCIGTACYTRDDAVCVTLRLAENSGDEPEILDSFSEQLDRCADIVTFNGTSFDLPFIKKRCGRPDLFKDKNSIDLLKCLQSMKKLLPLSDFRQKSAEQFLGIQREDTCSGKELIRVYHSWAKTGDERLFQLLTRHNLEDVLGMMGLLPLLSYRQLFTGRYRMTAVRLQTFTDYRGKARSEYEADLTFATPVPIPLHFSERGCRIALREKRALVQIPVYEGSLRHYLKDWKNHRYLTIEKMIVHKSVTAFMDKEVYRRAAAEECFVSKEGRFLPLFTDRFPDELKDAALFYKDYHDHSPYLDIDNVEDGCAESCVRHLLSFLLR